MAEGGKTDLESRRAISLLGERALRTEDRMNPSEVRKAAATVGRKTRRTERK
jgi:hypothetical protein